MDPPSSLFSHSSSSSGSSYHSDLSSSSPFRISLSQDASSRGGRDSENSLSDSPKNGRTHQNKLLGNIQNSEGRKGRIDRSSTEETKPKVWKFSETSEKSTASLPGSQSGSLTSSRREQRQWQKPGTQMNSSLLSLSLPYLGSSRQESEVVRDARRAASPLERLVLENKMI